jgi:hypothetical protein
LIAPLTTASFPRGRGKPRIINGVWAQGRDGGRDQGSDVPPSAAGVQDAADSVMAPAAPTVEHDVALHSNLEAVIDQMITDQDLGVIPDLSDLLNFGDQDNLDDLGTPPDVVISSPNSVEVPARNGGTTGAEDRGDEECVNDLSEGVDYTPPTSGRNDEFNEQPPVLTREDEECTPTTGADGCGPSTSSTTGPTKETPKEPIERGIPVFVSHPVEGELRRGRRRPPHAYEVCNRRLNCIRRSYRGASFDDIMDLAVQLGSVNPGCRDYQRLAERFEAIDDTRRDVTYELERLLAGADDRNLKSLLTRINNIRKWIALERTVPMMAQGLGIFKKEVVVPPPANIIVEEEVIVLNSSEDEEQDEPEAEVASERDLDVESDEPEESSGDDAGEESDEYNERMSDL